ncbi:hypothetical protein GlitD10_2122 [Gloeomargarita lithophora Alchichica-D10]|uniref:Uncharacterized protein n=1 Tax=Gloeomargarita lithophora Alchichica-D10 TaxID=1188229 RepID=A0A1J0AEX1_9CYAN|nr:hypothetical protein [Gloeomargarita lithophora]APB34451.1 hypothetical protein GlitD10_2122 [Gloeomargarita lithophora Alchichica-D10]
MQSRRTPRNTQNRSQIQRWYMGFKQKTGKVKPTKLLEVISREIQTRNLSRYLPIMRIEKSPKGEYYFFLAIESKGFEIPHEIAKLLKELKDIYFKLPVDKTRNCFELEQIKPMVGNAHDVTDYTNPIPYRSQTRTISESSLTLSDSNQTQPLDQERINNLSKNHEHFLYWLSAVGSGAWELFRKTCEILGLVEPKRVLRRLKLLGHITTSGNGSKWQVNPPSLLEIQSENGDRTFILHGQRSIKFLNTFRTFGFLETCNQPRGEAPPCIYFRLPSEIGYETLTQRMQEQGYSITLTPFRNIPDIATWYSNLLVVQGLLPYKFRLKKFNGQDFIDYTFQRETGFYQFFSQDIDSHPQYTFFYDQDSDQWVQGDWYGLRFWAIYQMNQGNLCAYYSEENNTLCVLFSHRWAEVYETHLVMSSGVLPRYESDTLIYQGISTDLVNELSQKLNISI